MFENISTTGSDVSELQTAVLLRQCRVPKPEVELIIARHFTDRSQTSLSFDEFADRLEPLWQHITRAADAFADEETVAARVAYRKQQAKQRRLEPRYKVDEYARSKQSAAGARTFQNPLDAADDEDNGGDVVEDAAAARLKAEEVAEAGRQKAKEEAAAAATAFAVPKLLSKHRFACTRKHACADPRPAMAGEDSGRREEGGRRGREEEGKGGGEGKGQSRQGGSQSGEGGR